ncbi:hypothetical protein LLB57_002127 [Escherichia coli]|nr:hypothetical protein [Escherichia coli]
MQNDASDTLLSRILKESEPVSQLPERSLLQHIHAQTEADTQRQRKEKNRLNSEILAVKICRWIKETGRGPDAIMYEADLRAFFKCSREELAIAASLIPLYSHQRELHGVGVMAYTAAPPVVLPSDLKPAERFLYHCLKRGYTGLKSEGWPVWIRTKSLYTHFTKSQYFDQSGQAVLSHAVTTSGIGRLDYRREHEGKKNRNTRVARLYPLEQAREEFAANVLNNLSFDWSVYDPNVDA